MILKRVQLSLFLLGLDLLSKVVALHWIPFFQGGKYPFGGIPLFENIFGISFSLNTIANTGAAWGILSGHPGLLFVLRISLVLGVSLYAFFFGKKWLGNILFWMIGAGAIGNLMDYLLYGYVIDFLHFVFWGYSFPIFNLADIYISLSVFCLLFLNPSSRVKPVV